MKKTIRFLLIILVLVVLIPRVSSSFKGFILNGGEMVFNEFASEMGYNKKYKVDKEDTSYEVSKLEEEVLKFTNIEREDNGLPPFELDKELSKVVRIKSEDMDQENYFDHVSPIYGSPFDMMDKFEINYITAGENIAMGHPSPKAVVNGWMNSKGHRENILNVSFNSMGVGVHKDSMGRMYWTQMFRN